MAKKNKQYRKKTTLITLLLFGFLFTSSSLTLATSVDRNAIVNLEGYPGKTIKQEITLEGTDPEARSGYWYTHYKKTDGDSTRMDITSWITIKPENYTINQGETQVFTIEIQIPKSAEPELWGATSEEAGREGHSGERRSYIVFKDANSEANVYSGLLIPISVKVLPSPNPFAAVFLFVQKNIITIVLSIVIVILLVLTVLKRKSSNTKRLHRSRKALVLNKR